MRRPTFLLALTSMLLFVGACGDEPTNPVLPQQFDTAPSGEFALAEAVWGPTPIKILERLEYEEFHGTIDPGEGGFLFAEMSTWPSGCYFSIQVPPDALTDDPGSGGSADPVPFSLSVPTYQSYMDHQYLNGGLGLPLTMHLEPSNLVFEVPVLVHATYMPWTGATAEFIWSLWTLDPVFDFYYLESVQDVKRKVRLSFKAPHFSRWETGGGPPSPNVRD